MASLGDVVKMGVRMLDESELPGGRERTCRPQNLVGVPATRRTVIVGVVVSQVVQEAGGAVLQGPLELFDDVLVELLSILVITANLLKHRCLDVGEHRDAEQLIQASSNQVIPVHIPVFSALGPPTDDPGDDEHVGLLTERGKVERTDVVGPSLDSRCAVEPINEASRYHDASPAFPWNVLPQSLPQVLTGAS